MPRHKGTRVLPYTAEQMFDLVADVESYPKFLPWVKGARIRKRDGDTIIADLMVGFKMIREHYTSRVVLDRPGRIDVTYQEGPFRHLENHWRFTDVEEGCRIDFDLDFEFRSRVLQKIIGGLFHEAVRKMVGAFETRAKKVYAPPAEGAARLAPGGETP